MTAVIADPAAFVNEAERMTNERDVDGVRTVFAPDGTMTATIDGLTMTAHGLDAIHEQWDVMCRFMQSRAMYVHKTLVSAGDRVIVNEWTGSLGGTTDARGIEVWELDDAGLVRSHRLYGFLNAGPATGVRPSLRMLASYPLSALSFARARLRSR